MGVGLYNLLGWGTLSPDVPADDEAREALYETLSLLGLDSTSECDPEYLVVRLAVDVECLQTWWKIPALPDSVLRCASRRARYADDAAFDVPEEARELWRKAQREFAKAGVTPADARLIVLNDWD